MIGKLINKVLNYFGPDANAQANKEFVDSLKNTVEVTTDFVNEDAKKLDRFKYMTEIPSQVFERNIAFLMLRRMEEKGTWKIWHLIDFKQTKDL